MATTMTWVPTQYTNYDCNWIFGAWRDFISRNKLLVGYIESKGLSKIVLPELANHDVSCFPQLNLIGHIGSHVNTTAWTSSGYI